MTDEDFLRLSKPEMATHLRHQPPGERARLAALYRKAHGLDPRSGLTLPRVSLYVLIGGLCLLLIGFVLTAILTVPMLFGIDPGWAGVLTGIVLRTSVLAILGGGLVLIGRWLFLMIRATRPPA